MRTEIKFVFAHQLSRIFKEMLEMPVSQGWFKHVFRALTPNQDRGLLKVRPKQTLRESMQAGEEAS